MSIDWQKLYEQEKEEHEKTKTQLEKKDKALKEARENFDTALKGFEQFHKLFVITDDITIRDAEKIRVLNLTIEKKNKEIAAFRSANCRLNNRAFFREKDMEKMEKEIKELEAKLEKQLKIRNVEVREQDAGAARQFA